MVGTGPCSLVRALLVVAVTISPALLAQQPSVQDLDADALVQQLRNLPPHLPAGPISQLCPKSGPCPPPPLPPEEAKRQQIYSQLEALGVPAVQALARGLRGSDVNLKLNVLLALDVLGGGWYTPLHRVNIGAALPSLTMALDDSNPEVRGWAAQDIGDIGSAAGPAVPKLIMLLSDKGEGVRNSACLGLTFIGPAAKSALPVLRRRALSDPSHYVRSFAQRAIWSIEVTTR